MSDSKVVRLVRTLKEDVYTYWETSQLYDESLMASCKPPPILGFHWVKFFLLTGVIFLDGLEKAYKDMAMILFQILDEGQKVDFKIILPMI